MLKVVAAPIFILVLFLAYTIHSEDISVREMREYNHEITVYSKVGCVYCERAMELLEERKLHYYNVDLTWDEEMREKLTQQTGSHTLPIIFIDNKYIGGCSDLIKLSDSGELDQILK